MTRNIGRRLARIEARRRETELTRLTDAELDARIERAVADLLEAHPAHQLQEMFATMPDVLTALGLNTLEIPHAPH